MTVSQDALESALGHDHAGGRQPWIRPDVRRLDAGAAENGGASATDLGVNFS
jgi:hypothetical protein